jgi:hypothetical protein
MRKYRVWKTASRPVEGLIGTPLERISSQEMLLLLIPRHTPQFCSQDEINEMVIEAHRQYLELPPNERFGWRGALE